MCVCGKRNATDEFMQFLHQWNVWNRHTRSCQMTQPKYNLLLSDDLSCILFNLVCSASNTKIKWIAWVFNTQYCEIENAYTFMCIEPFLFIASAVSYVTKFSKAKRHIENEKLKLNSIHKHTHTHTSRPKIYGYDQNVHSTMIFQCASIKLHAKTCAKVQWILWYTFYK